MTDKTLMGLPLVEAGVEIPGLIEFGKLEWRPGDVLVLRTPSRMSMDAHRRLLDSLNEVFGEAGKGMRVLILENGQDISILRKEDLPVE